MSILSLALTNERLPYGHHSASQVVKGDIKEVRERLLSAALAVEIYLLFSVKRRCFTAGPRGHPDALGKLIGAFLAGVNVVPWTQAVARCYGDLRASCESAGISLTPSDMMIAAHAKAIGAVLVTRDKAFGHIKADLFGLEDWTEA